jgi:hypothetical protein
MAQPPLAILTLLELLAQDSDFQIPAADADVKTALAEYRAVHATANSQKAKAERRQLLAGLTWLHLHHLDLAAQVARLSGDHQRILASALGVDLAAHVGKPSWPALLSRRIVAHAVPGATPVKRSAPVAATSGQIQKPGGVAPPPDPPAHEDDDSVQFAGFEGGPDPRTRKRQVRRKIRHSSSEDSSGDDLDAPSRKSAPAPPPAPMPDVYLKSPGNDALAAAWCFRPWLPTLSLESAVPARHYACVFKGSGWTPAVRRAYDKMLKEQRRAGRSSSRAEDPLDPGFVHRLKLAYRDDDRLAADSRVLAALLGCERLSDYAGPSAASLGGNGARAEFRSVYSETDDAWQLCARGIRDGQTLSSIASGAFAAQVNLLMERRYDRFVRILPAGPPRDEILANTYRQIGEVADYIRDFDTDLMRRASKLPYAEQPRFVGERFLSAYTACMAVFLDTATGPVPGGIVLSDLPAYGSGAPAPVRPSAPKSSKPPPTPASPQPAPAPPPQYLPPSSHPPLPPFLSWPAFAPPPGFSPTPTAGGGGHGGGGAGGLPGPFASPHSAPPTPAAKGKVKGEPLSGKAAARKAAGLPFCAQPHHAWTAGADLANQPAGGGSRLPGCHCGNQGIASYSPGPHATWDCPLRYVKIFGFCPGFLPSGLRDLSQWQGDTLTRAAKDAWAAFIDFEELPLPTGDWARAPNFRA